MILAGSQSYTIVPYQQRLDSRAPAGVPVPPPNLGPTWAPTAPTSLSYDNTGSHYFDWAQYASDPNDDTLSYSLPVTRTGITIHGTSGLMTIDAVGTDGEVTVRMSDGSLHADHVVQISVQPAAQQMKWYPGHYPYPDSLLLPEKISSINTGIDQILAIPANRVRGVKLMVPWGQVERTSRGVYDWANLDAALTRIGGPLNAPTGRVAFVDFWWQQFNTGGLPGTPQNAAYQFLPDYIIDAGWAYWVDSSDNLYVKMWLPGPVDDFIRFMEAVAQRYDTDPRVAFMGCGEGSWGTPDDGSISAEDKRAGTLAQMRRLMPAMRSAFAHTPFFLYNNFTGGQVDCGLLVQDQVDIGGGLGCPDVALVGNSITPSTAIPEQYSYRWLRGDRYSGGAWTVGAGPDQRLSALTMTEKQVNRHMSWTPSLVLALATAQGTYKPHVMCWSLHTTAYLREHSGDPNYRIPALDRSAVIAWFQAQTPAAVALRADKPSTL